MNVTSPKTKRYGKGSRTVPLYPEFREELERAYDLTPEGVTYVVNEKYRRAAQSKIGWRNVNLRTQFEKIIWRAELQPWPNLFHSMRSSRATELLDDGHSVHTVAEWQGDRVDVLIKHYARVRGRHVAKAAQVNEADIDKAAKGAREKRTASKALQ